MSIKKARNQPFSFFHGRAEPRIGEVGIYWPSLDRTDFYAEYDFYEDQHLQNLASDQGEVIEP